MKEESPYPLADKIRELEDKILSNYMIGRMYESEQLRNCCVCILDLLKIARGYIVVGRERKALRIFLRAAGLREIMISQFELDLSSV